MKKLTETSCIVEVVKRCGLICWEKLKNNV